MQDTPMPHTADLHSFLEEAERVLQDPEHYRYSPEFLLRYLVSLTRHLLTITPDESSWADDTVIPLKKSRKSHSPNPSDQHEWPENPWLSNHPPTT